MSITNRVGVIGLGKVGTAIKELLQDHYEILTYDVNKDSNKMAEVFAADYAVVCVNTPMGPDGKCDITHVSNVFDGFSEHIDHFLIKSAIPPGTTEAINNHYDCGVSVSPEYVGEGGYFVPYWKGYPDPQDMKKHQFQIFGGKREETNDWIEIFQRVMGPEPEYIQTDSKTAELTKYMENVWIATKVSFVNEIFNIAEAFDIDYRELRELWLKDGRVSRMHTSVFEGDRGFGGHCLPKDLNAIIKATEQAGYSPDLLKSVKQFNQELRSEKNGTC